MGADGVDGGVAKDGWCETSCPGSAVGVGATVATPAEDVAHGIRADVAEIDNHTQTIHFFDESLSCGADATPERCRTLRDSIDGNDCGVSVAIVTIPRESGVSRTELMVEA